ncbi:MAG: FAD-binding oxidoreductase [Myxococcales bacterium]|nr:FAD-binding oxidoreductase [Myxococcales bacterium]
MSLAPPHEPTPTRALRRRHSDFGDHHASPGCDELIVMDDLETLQRAVLRANERGLRIRVRGRGHSMNGSSLARPGELLLTTASASRYRLERPGTITVGAGAAIYDVHAMLRARGLGLLVYNDGDQAAPSVGGYVSAGGFGEASDVHGGFWETVTDVTMVAGDGRVLDCRPGDALFPWLFGSMGQLGIIHEVTLRITADAGAVYPLGERGVVPASAPRWERLLWYTIFAPARRGAAAARELGAIGRRFAHLWRARPDYAYNLRFHRFNPPLIHPAQEDLVAVGVWGDAPGPEGFDHEAFRAVDREVMAMLRRNPDLRRYLQSELTFAGLDHRACFGAEVHARFLEHVARLDPRGVLRRF